MPLARLISAALILVCLAACGGSSESETDAGPPGWIYRNPDIAAYREREPGGIGDIVRRIEALRTLPDDPDVQLPQNLRDTGTPTEESRRRARIVDAVRRNPVIREIYKKDPKATVKLIDIILVK